MRTIPFTNGGGCMVSDEDYEVQSAFNWQRHKHGYAYRYTRHRPAPGRSILMHREIIGAPPSAHVDHIDGNPANNQRENLRLCNMTQNLANQQKMRGRKGKPCSSPHKGVSLDRRSGRWISSCNDTHLGSFATEEEAAAAYDVHAIYLWGEFARTNVFIQASQRGKIE